MGKDIGEKVTVIRDFWRCLSRMVVACVAVFLFTNTAVAACSSNQIDVLGDGTQCETVKFSVTTTSDATRAYFYISAAGIFYIDCGDGGTLSGPGVSGQTVDRTGNASAGDFDYYRCRWSTAGAHTMRFSGTATAYNTNSTTNNTSAAIAFGAYQYGTADKIASVSGSLGALFPVLGTSSGEYPRFCNTFYGATNLTSIPSTLFSGITYGNTGVFRQTFKNCTSLTNIPAGLFSDITTIGGNYVFNATFENCTNLSGFIPPDTFAGMVANNAPTSVSGYPVFGSMFSNTNMATSCPSGTIPYSLGYSFSDDVVTCNCTSGYYSPNSTTCTACSNSKPANSSFKISTAATCPWDCDSGYAKNGNNTCTACSSNQFSANDTCTTNKFSLTTTSGTSYFDFKIVASGTFYVNCGDGGTLHGLSGANAYVNGNTITQDSVSYNTYRCVWPSEGAHTIKFGGAATGYTAGNYYGSGAIQFVSAANVASVTGSLGAVFPQLGTNDGEYPMFNGTFKGCTNLTSVPSTLFSGITGGGKAMFASTFYGCTGLTTIPAGLFSGIDTRSATNTSDMFRSTFYNCTSLTGYIPPTAFPNTIVPGSSSSGSMWYQTFYNTQLATSCPAGTGEYNTGFQNDWGYSNSNTTTSGTYRVSCEPCGTLPANATWITGTCTWACDGGYYSANGTSCTAVETGYYSPAGDNTRTACTNGPANSLYTGSGGATDSCLWACDGGYYSTNGTSCTAVETGYYSPAGSNTRTACTNGPANSTYTGSGGATNSCLWECSANYFADNGTCVACSSVGDGSYTNSAAGATINTQCYKACTTSTANIAHATAITGNDYYGVGRDTCEPTACESGYHVKSINLADSDLRLIYLRSYNNEGYISNNGARSSNQNTYELTENGTFGTTYDVYGVTKITKGRAQCSTQIGTGAWNGAMSYNEVTTSATLPDSTGQYCYCALDEYIPDDGAPMSVSGPWVFKYKFDGYQYGSGNCVDGCARVCAQTSNTDQNGRDIMFVYKYLLTATSVTCDANSYTITYSAGTGTGSNQTQNVTYNAAFTTKPANTFTMANATFAGWSPSAGSYTVANTEYTYTQTDNITLTAQWTCDAGYYLSGGACVDAGVGYYSPAGDNARYSCTNAPANATYTAGGTTSSCPWACDTGYINTGTACETAKFSVTTTSDTTSLSWTMSATGPFVADCGDGGTLSQNTSSYGTISGSTIIRTGTSSTTYTCTWGTAGAHTVRFGGTATGYTISYAAISFYKSGGTQDKVASIDGSLGAMFPVINGAVPRFSQTFYGTQITSIPSGLFSAIDTSAATDTSSMFSYTFSGTQITSIPAGLFSTIDTSAATNTSSMFSGTFYNCTSLQSIPSGLFSEINTSSATNTSSMFSYTFYGTQITSIPSGLFSKIDTSASTATFYMFNATFSGTQITSIPAGLFSGINTSAATNTSYMFSGTFSSCTNLGGYIPPTAFPNTITPGSSSSNMWYNTFFRTQLLTSCPAGTGEYNTGFQNDWGYSNNNTTTSGTHRVSCEPCGTFPTNSSQIVNTCDWACDGGYYSANGTSCTAVETGYYSPAGDNTRTACTNGPTNSSYSGSGGATNSCDWTCDAGYYYDNGTCTACAAGTYKAAAGNATSCTTPDDGYYVSTTGQTTQTQCPTGYRSGSDGGRDEITDCYVTANATCTQNECSNPDTTGCSGYTCAASCSCAGTTTYKQYSNAAGTGNGTTSGTTTESCTKAVASLTAKANYYADGTTSCPACSSVGDGSYTLSAAGVTMNTQCYKDCTTSTANIAHATAVSGNDYYGAGTDTCVATECDSGYAVSNGACQITSCTGATYMDSDLNTCVACPPGYDAHTTAGKTSVTQCQIACTAGTYIENPGMIGYTRLEYLESSGTQYIDTGFVHNSSNIRGEILVGTTNEITANVNILGNQAGSGTSKAGYSIGWTPSLFKLWVNKVGNRLNGPTHALTAGTTHYIEYRLTDTQRWLTYDGQTVTDFHTGGIVTNKPIHLFDNGDHQMNQNFKGRIYFIRIYEDGVLVHNFVPASRDTDGALGIYDTVKKRFFENSNTGTFSYDDNINMGCVNVGYGHYAGASTTNYGDVGTRTACPLGTYSNIDNGTSAAACVACVGATYADETGSRTCKNCPSGFTYNTTSGKTSATQCQINCAAGKYVPISYERLDYIESTGTQYIPTEINVSTLVNPVMTLDVQYTATENNKQTGAGTGTSAANQFVVGMSSSQFQCSLANGKNVAAWDTNRHTFVADAANGTCSVDNTTVNVTPGNLSAINKPIYIGGVGGVDARVAKAKYYGFKLESNGTLIMDLVPARRVSDNTVGMYDMISGNFLGGYGGVFGVGSVLNSSICTDVDTGYYAAGGPVNYGSTLAQTACSNKPEHSEYTGGASTNACPFACDTGLVFNNGACVDECNGVMYGGECHERCSVGSGLFNAGEYSYPLFADRGGISSPVIGVKYPNGSVCYLYFEADTGEEHGFKTLYNNSTYHAIDPR